MKELKEDKSKLLQAFLKRGGWTLLSFFFLVIVWIAVAAIVGNAYLLPSIGETFKAMVGLLGNNSFWSAYGATLLRAILSFIISFVFAGAVAFLSYSFPEAEKLFAPIFSLLRSLPTMAILLIITLWTGATVAPIVVGVLVLMPMLYAAMLGAKTAVNGELLEMSRIYGVSKKRQIRSLIIPSIFPSLSREGVSALSLALKLTVSAEIMSNTFQSLGGQMQTANLYAQTPVVFALAMLIFFTGFFIEAIGMYAIKRVEERFL